MIESERVDWKRIAPQLDALFAAAGTAEYVIFNPWWPGLEKRVRMFRSVFPHGSGTFEQVAVGALTLDSPRQSSRSESPSVGPPPARGASVLAPRSVR